MNARAAGFARLSALLAALLASLPARADTGLALLQSLRGNVNVAGTAGTLRLKDDQRPRTLASNSNSSGSGIHATLSGLPADPGTPAAPDGLSVVFTREACAPGQPIVVAPGEAGCHRFIGPVTAAAGDVRIHVTAVQASDGVPYATAVDSRDTRVAIDLAASCAPFSGVAPGYAGLALDCKGGWKTASVTLPANQATAVLPPNQAGGPASAFFYADVGRVTLSMRYGGTVMGTASFVSRPADLRLREVLNADGFPDQMGRADDQWTKPLASAAGPNVPAFAQAGEPFTLRLGALMADGNWAPSFGKEADALEGVLPAADLDLDFRLDLFAADPKAAPALPLAGLDEAVRDAFVVERAFAPSGAVAGAFDARVRWYEAGYLGMTPWLVDYLGTGRVGGAAEDTDPASAARMVAGTRLLGRFYPEHFETRVDANFDCLPGMRCPATEAATQARDVDGATYSRQPFGITVTAYAPERAGVAKAPLRLFRYFREHDVVLSAVLPAGATVRAGDGLATDPLDYGGKVGDGAPMKTRGSYRFAAAFEPAERRARTLNPPTPVYLRATMAEYRPGAGGKATATTVSSAQPAGAPAGSRYEGGVQVVAGRLQVATVFGSELLRLPVPLAAQYWSGTSWLASATDSDSTVAAGIGLLACSKAFAAAGAGACKPGILAVADGAAAIRLDKGAGRMVLRAPGRGNAGTIDFSATGGNAAGWLPSTTARATFGLYRSPFIYLREVY